MHELSVIRAGRSRKHGPAAAHLAVVTVAVVTAVAPVGNAADLGPNSIGSRKSSWKSSQKTLQRVKKKMKWKCLEFSLSLEFFIVHSVTVEDGYCAYLWTREKLSQYLIFVTKGDGSHNISFLLYVTISFFYCTFNSAYHGTHASSTWDLWRSYRRFHHACCSLRTRCSSHESSRECTFRDRNCYEIWTCQQFAYQLQSSCSLQAMMHSSTWDIMKESTKCPSHLYCLWQSRAGQLRIEIEDGTWLWPWTLH